MCGLAGVFAFSPDAAPVDAAELTAMRDAMIARGPDGAGNWIAPDGRVGLAHRRLSIIDLSQMGSQPMVSEDGRRIIIYNGEVYNFPELRDAMTARGHVFRSRSDTEVLLALWREMGPAMVERLRGMFAFAIWDEDRRGLFLARDHFGIKPLYYSRKGGTLRFASQVKALLAGGMVGGGLDAAAAVGFHLLGSVPEPFTIDRDIAALPSGHRMWVDAEGRGEPECYFDPADVLSRPPRATSDLREALMDSVGHHLLADVPVGVFLSSGLDSTTIAAIAAESRGQSLRSFTLGFEEFRGSPSDEVPLAETMAAAINTDHATRWVRSGDFRDHLPALLAAMDQPSIDGVNIYFVAKAAAESGLKVALSGLGGDELFAGYDTFREVPQLVGALEWLPGGRILGRGFRMIATHLLAERTSPKWAGVLEYGTRYGDAWLLRRGLFMPWELPQILDPDLVREGWRRLDPLLRLDSTHFGINSPRAKVQALEISWYMKNQLLRDADWAGMAHSLEIRVPLVDVELFRRTAGGNFSKRDMARTPRPALPESIINRPKSGFFVPVRDWLGGNGKERGLRGWAKTVFAPHR